MPSDIPEPRRKLPIAEMVRHGVRQLATELYALRHDQPLKIKKLSLEHQIAFRDSDAPPDTSDATANYPES